MNTTHDFGELRSLLERAPSPGAFDLVCQRLEAAHADEPDRVRAEWLPHVEGRLDQWPGASRRCPKPRLADFESGEPVWCHLVRALDYEGVSISAKRLDSILAAPDIDHLTHLDLRSANLKWDRIAKLAKDAPFHLKSFGFRRVSAIDWDALDALFSSEMLSAVDTLTFRGWDKIKADVYPHLIEHFPLNQLRSLDLSGGAVSSRTLKLLLETDALDGLEVFRAGAWVADKGGSGLLPLFAKRTGMTGLSTLHVREAKPKGIEALADAAHLATLRELRIDGPLDAASLSTLLSSPHLTGLEDLHVTLADDTAGQAFRMLADSDILPNLHTLYLNWWEQSGGAHDALAAMLAAGPLTNLRRLAIPLDDPKTFDAFAAHADALPNLEQLTLQRILHASDWASVPRLFSGEDLPNLEALTVSFYPDSPAVLSAVRRSELFARVKHVRLLDANDAELVKTLKSSSVAHLETLDLRRSGVFAMREIMPALEETTHLGRLESLILPSRHWASGFEEVRARGAHHLPEFLSVRAPEDAFLQQFDWL